MRYLGSLRRQKTVRYGAWGALWLLVWFLAHSVVAALFGLAHEEAAGDLGVVMGAHVRDDGTPGYSLERRLARALELYAKGSVRYLYVSGGAPEGIIESGPVMYRVLREAGVPDSALIVDDVALTTFDTGRIARRIMDERCFDSAVVITSYYHVLRSWLALRLFGIVEVRTAHATISHEKRHPSLFFRPGMWWHEFVGFYWYPVRRVLEG